MDADIPTTIDPQNAAPQSPPEPIEGTDKGADDSNTNPVGQKPFLQNNLPDNSPNATPPTPTNAPTTPAHPPPGQYPPIPTTSPITPPPQVAVPTLPTTKRIPTEPTEKFLPEGGVSSTETLGPTAESFVPEKIHTPEVERNQETLPTPEIPQAAAHKEKENPVVDAQAPLPEKPVPVVDKTAELTELHDLEPKDKATAHADDEEEEFIEHVEETHGRK
jgi:hypothetical protein